MQLRWLRVLSSRVVQIAALCGSQCCRIVVLSVTAYVTITTFDVGSADDALGSNVYSLAPTYGSNLRFIDVISATVCVSVCLMFAC